MLEEKIIKLQITGLDNSEEALAFLSDKLEEKGVVNNQFKENILKREIEFATGLYVNGVGVAIPHTDPDYVNYSQIALMTLKNPIDFKQMGDHSVDVPVQIIFMLALKESHQHLEMLQKLVEFIQNTEAINTLLALEDEKTDKDEVKKILEKNNII